MKPIIKYLIAFVGSLLIAWIYNMLTNFSTDTSIVTFFTLAIAMAILAALDKVGRKEE